MKYIYILFIVVFVAACNDDFLDRYPETSISEKNFFSNINDLQTYTYQFYDYWNTEYWDRPSDNTTIEKEEIRGLMLGTISADNYGGWGKGSWGHLRSINYFLDNYKNAIGDAAEINKYAAIAHYARAVDYIGKVKTYSDVPWYSTTLGTDDLDELYKARDTRELVVDSIIADLEFAMANLKVEKEKTLLSKWAAYAQLARFCLYEGSYRQYHAGETDLHVTKSPDYFYSKAVEAANAIMASGAFSIYSAGNVNEDYSDIFNGGTDLANNPEIIMLIDYEDDKREHGAELVLEFENGVSRSMADSYLKVDGSFMTAAETSTLELNDAFTGRDPRMKQSIFFPGYIHPQAGNAYKLSINKTGGYAQIKFMPKEKGTNFDGYMTVHTDLPLFRYAEVLLIYAEAKAELGQLSQADLDNTVNLLRDRVGLAHLSMNPPIDPVQDALYTGITSSQKAELLEIRRERRVELFAEGYRYSDMMRWKEGKLFEKPQQGIYIPASGLLDITGDGEADYFISDDGSNVPADLPAGATQLITNDDNVPFFLENGKSGHIKFKLEQTNMGSFIEPTYYYRPIPTSELLLNPNLKQLFGW